MLHKTARGIRRISDSLNQGIQSNKTVYDEQR